MQPILQNGWIIWSPFLYFNVRSFENANSWSFITFQWIRDDAVVLLLGFWNFLKWNRVDLISCGEPILQNSWIIWSPLLYFNFGSLKDPHCLSFIRFQCVVHDAIVLFSGFWNFFKWKRGDLISRGEAILQNSCIIWSPLLYLKCRSLKDPNSLLFIRFQCVLHDAGGFFWGFWNFLKLKRGDLISWDEAIL